MTLGSMLHETVASKWGDGFKYIGRNVQKFMEIGIKVKCILIQMFLMPGVAFS